MRWRGGEEKEMRGRGGRAREGSEVEGRGGGEGEGGRKGR